MINPMDLRGKCILLYGADTGIDDAILYQVRELGAEIVCYSKVNMSAVESDIKTISQESGPFDGFVFTLTHSDFRPLQFVRPESVSEILNDNYCLFVEAMRILSKNKVLKDGASVVALSSISSIRAMKAKMAFCSAKAALDAAVRCLASELADKRIRVNSIQKGVVDADFKKEHIKDVSLINHGDAEKKTHLGFSTAEEIANLVAFLLSDATKTITGTSIVIDGGYTL